jgi:hypothetical protein
MAAQQQQSQDEHSRSPFGVTESFASAPTIDEVVRECDRAWEYAKNARATRGLTRISTMSDESREKAERQIYETILDEFRDLCTTYPTIVAAMVTGAYDRRAVRKFFKYVRAHPWKGESEFLDVQSAYSAILMRALAKDRHHVGAADIAAVREHTRKELEATETKTRTDIDRATEAAKSVNARRAAARVEDLRASIWRDGSVLIADEVRPVEVSFDDAQ